MALLAGIKSSRRDELRTEYHHAFEHGSGPALRIYAPHWLARWRDETGASRRSHQTNGEAARALKFDSSLKEYKAKTARLEYEEKAGILVKEEKIWKQLGEFCRCIREGIESLPPMEQEIMVSMLEEAKKITVEEGDIERERYTSDRRIGLAAHNGADV